MLTVQDDWIQYAEVPVRRTAVRGGGACAQRIPVVRAATAGRPVLVAVPALVGSPGRPSRRAGRGRRPGAAARPLRLTRRGRLVLIVLPGLLVLGAGAVAVADAVGAAGPAPAPVLQARLESDRAVTVMAGDPLWSIAQRVSPQQDPRAVVDALRRTNGLHLPAGTVLHLPPDR